MTQKHIEPEPVGQPWQNRFRSLISLALRNRSSAYIFSNLTFKRACNYLIVKVEKKLRRTTMKGRPYHIILDPVNICNFRCPLCRTGSLRNRRKKGMMTFDTFKRLLDPLAGHAIMLTLHNWGEPFLNKDIYRMIAYAKSRGLSVCLSSNLYAMERRELEMVVDSGLDHLKVSLDGASDETYATYRVGGQFSKVFDNLNTLMEIRRDKGSRFPLVEWQFLVMRHNEHEIPVLQKMSREAGVDMLTLGKIGFGEAPYDGTSDRELIDKWLPLEHPEYRYAYDGGYLFDAPCFFLWETVTLNWDGGLAPCCVLDEEGEDFGNALEEPAENIWNNAWYRRARQEFSLRAGLKTGDGKACLKCRIFRKI